MTGFSFRWKNFRNFRDTGWITVRPVTVFIGTNNSGKTSLISPLLLMRQTEFSRDPHLALKLRGDLINCGSYENVAHRHDKNLRISFSFRFPHQEIQDAERPFSSPQEEKELAPEDGSTLALSTEFVFSSATTEAGVQLHSYFAQDHATNRYLRRTLLSRGGYSLNFSMGGEKGKVSAKSLGSGRRHDTPENFTFGPQAVLNHILGIISEFTEDASQAATKGDRKTVAPKFTEEGFAYVQTTGFVRTVLARLLVPISYIGPLREHPRRFYELSGEQPDSVGIRGEYAPEILHRHRDAGFRSRVSFWLDQFGVSSLADEASSEPGIFALNFKNDLTGEVTPFADNGFGISQVLPLIVEGLAPKKGRLLIAEQPEIHLNPRLQCTLADLFVEIAREGKAVMVETHSEHLLLRLRRLIAEGKISHTDVALYFVQKEDDGSTVSHIPIDSAGHIKGEKWPHGFFEESLRESLALSAAQG